MSHRRNLSENWSFHQSVQAGWTVFPILAIVSTLTIIPMRQGDCQVQAVEIQSKSLQRYEFRQIRMGVHWKIIFYAQTNEQALDVQKAVYNRVREIDRALSDYDPDSELNQLCKNAITGQPMKISEDLFYVLQQSIALSKQSQGAFDVTVGHLTDLWRRAYRRNELPGKEKLLAALEKTDYRYLSLNADAKTVTFSKSGLQLDLGGIAKGYAADEALKVCQQHGINRALIDASGDIVVGDPPPGQTGWRVGIAPLRESDEQPELMLSLKNMAVATSGDANRYVEIDGIRYSHIVDPKTGYGLTTPSSVTVIATDGTLADGLASALSVTGPKRGFCQLIDEQSAALMILGTSEGLETHQTENFRTYLILEDDQ